MKNADAFIVDELVNKIKYFHFALTQAHSIITTLEKENTRLKDAVANLASVNSEDLCSVSEEHNDRLCAV